GNGDWKWNLRVMPVNALGSARVSRAGEGVAPSRIFQTQPQEMPANELALNAASKVRFGGTPKPARETRALPQCIHCGLAFSPVKNRTQFCCAGCEFVFNLIHKNGLEKFYELQNGTPSPVQSLVFQKRDYDWLSELVKAAEASDHAALTLDLQG